MCLQALVEGHPKKPSAENVGKTAGKITKTVLPLVIKG
jgi:hypothetical protein